MIRIQKFVTAEELERVRIERKVSRMFLRLLKLEARVLKLESEGGYTCALCGQQRPKELPEHLRPIDESSQ